MQNNYVSVIRNALRSLHYTYQQQALNDAVNLCQNIQSLKPKMLNYRHANGNTETLIALDGTIPMYFKKRKYNIPVKMYLTKLHPVQAPYCHVSPTSSMMVKPKHKHVAQKDGRIYLPYLSKWNFQSSTLYDLVNVMSTVFGQDPPVFKKPSNLQTSSSFPTVQKPMMNNMMNNSGGGSTGGGFNPYNYGNPMVNNPYGYKAKPKKKRMSPEEILKKKKMELTQKVQVNLRTVVKDYTKKLDNAMKDQRALEERTKSQSFNEGSLSKEVKAKEAKVKTMEGYIEKSIKNIEAHQGKEIDVDNVIKISDVLSKQYIEVNADNLAYDDMFYLLDKALLNETIEIDEWLKQTRKLAAKQFLKRALLNKINQKRRF